MVSVAVAVSTEISQRNNESSFVTKGCYVLKVW